jgi:hypothetical protein
LRASSPESARGKSWPLGRQRRACVALLWRELVCRGPASAQGALPPLAERPGHRLQSGRRRPPLLARLPSWRPAPPGCSGRVRPAPALSAKGPGGQRVRRQSLAWRQGWRQLLCRRLSAARDGRLWISGGLEEGTTFCRGRLHVCGKPRTGWRDSQLTGQLQWCYLCGLRRAFVICRAIKDPQPIVTGSARCPTATPERIAASPRARAQPIIQKPPWPGEMPRRCCSSSRRCTAPQLQQPALTRGARQRRQRRQRPVHAERARCSFTTSSSLSQRRARAAAPGLRVAVRPRRAAPARRVRQGEFVRRSNLACLLTAPHARGSALPIGAWAVHDGRRQRPRPRSSCAAAFVAIAGAVLGGDARHR